MDVGLEVHSTMREHCGQGRNEEYIMWSLKDLGSSAYSTVDINARVEPSEGKRGTEGDDVLRCFG